MKKYAKKAENVFRKMGRFVFTFADDKKLKHLVYNFELLLDLKNLRFNNSPENRRMTRTKVLGDYSISKFCKSSIQTASCWKK